MAITDRTGRKRCKRGVYVYCITFCPCFTFAADLPEEVAFVVEDLDAVGSVVADEDLLPVVDDHPVGELQVLRAAELVQHVAKLVEDDHPHYLGIKILRLTYEQICGIII